jgi:hypothetical protein
MSLETASVQCPYCGEMIDIDVEPTSEPQNYIQDCSVCCRPIQFDVVPGEDGPEVNASRSD